MINSCRSPVSLANLAGSVERDISEMLTRKKYIVEWHCYFLREKNSEDMNI